MKRRYAVSAGAEGCAAPIIYLNPLLAHKISVCPYQIDGLDS